MDAYRWEQLRTLFDELVGLQTAERALRLDAIGEKDRDLRLTLDSLLSADAVVDARLQRIESSLLPHEIQPLGLADECHVPDLFGLTGRAVAHFRVLEPIGAGGMGIVYRADDTRLGRVVALKFLLPQHGLDVSAKHRFLREARAAAALDHRNICTIYEVGESSDGWSFLAMPLYPGETLKSRLGRQSRLEIDETVEIARQIADGLACAHAAGVVHRDLKPGNLMLLSDGTVKILDFGLAKSRDQSITGSMERLGTPAYMAPEQLAGDAHADHRVDLYALGIITYEMLAGSTPVIVRTAEDSPITRLMSPLEPVTTRRQEVPPMLAAVVTRLLASRASDRPSSAAEVREVLSRIVPMPARSTTATSTDSRVSADLVRLGSPRFGISVPAAGVRESTQMDEVVRPEVLVDPLAPMSSSPGRAGVDVEGTATLSPDRTRQPLNPGAWKTSATVVGIASLMGISVLAVSTFVSERGKPESVSLDIEAPVVNGVPQHLGDLAISPDGKTVAFIGRSDSASQVYVRGLKDVEARAIPGTQRGGQIAFSPDGKWLSVISYDGTVLKATVDGSSTQVVGIGAFYWAGAVWQDNQTLLIGDSPAADRGIARMPVEGGGPSRVTTAISAEHARPLVAPDGNTLLFENWGHGDLEDDFLAIGSAKTGEYTVTPLLATQPIAVVNNTILFLTPAGAIMDVPFDTHGRQLTGTAVRLMDGVIITRFPDVPAAALSATGTLAYKRGEVRQRIAVTDIETGGRRLLTDEHEFGRSRPTMSPDGNRVAAEVITRHLDTVSTDIWIFDLRAGTSSRLTDTRRASAPEWTPDGRYVVYLVKGPGVSMIARRVADGSLPAETLLLWRGDVLAATPTPNGRGVVYCASADPALEFFYLPLNGSRTTERLAWSSLLTLDCSVRVSPDGKWMAFVATDGENPNIFVSPMHASGRVQISPDGGDSPVWSRDGRRLYYRRIDTGSGALFAGITSRSLFVADLRFEKHNLEVAKRSPVLTLGEYGLYDVSGDGKRVIMLQQTSSPHIVVVANWLQQVRARLPTGKVSDFP